MTLAPRAKRHASHLLAAITSNMQEYADGKAAGMLKAGAHATTSVSHEETWEA